MSETTKTRKQILAENRFKKWYSNHEGGQKRTCDNCGCMVAYFYYYNHKKTNKCKKLGEQRRQNNEQIEELEEVMTEIANAIMENPE